MLRSICLLACLAVWGASASEARAQLLIGIAESGSDVVMTVSGSVNLTGLTGGGTVGAFLSPQARIRPASARAIVFGTVSGDGYGGFTGPTSLGSGTTTVTTTTTSDIMVGFSDFTTLVMPGGYTSGTSLSASSTFVGATITSIGLTPGTYLWTWGGGDKSTGQAVEITITASAIPEPGPLALSAAAGSFAMAGLWRRRALRHA